MTRVNQAAPTRARHRARRSHSWHGKARDVARVTRADSPWTGCRAPVRDVGLRAAWFTSQGMRSPRAGCKASHDRHRRWKVRRDACRLGDLRQSPVWDCAWRGSRHGAVPLRAALRTFRSRSHSGRRALWLASPGRRHCGLALTRRRPRGPDAGLAAAISSLGRRATWLTSKWKGCAPRKPCAWQVAAVRGGTASGEARFAYASRSCSCNGLRALWLAPYGWRPGGPGDGLALAVRGMRRRAARLALPWRRHRGPGAGTSLRPSPPLPVRPLDFVDDCYVSNASYTGNRRDPRRGWSRCANKILFYP